MDTQYLLFFFFIASLLSCHEFVQELCIVSNLNMRTNQKGASEQKIASVSAVFLYGELCTVLQCRTDTSLQVSRARIELTTIEVEP